MTNREKYLRWVQACKHIDSQYITGNITTWDMDRIVANLEERLGMNTWDRETWMDAMREGERGQ